MNKKRIKMRILAKLLCFALAFSIPMQSFATSNIVTTNPNTVTNSQLTFDQQINNAIDSLNIAIESKEPLDFIESIKLIYALPDTNKDDTIDKEDVIYRLSYFLTSENVVIEINSDEFNNLASTIIAKTEEMKSQNYIELSKNIVLLLPKGDLRTTISTRIQAIVDTINKAIADNPKGIPDANTIDYENDVPVDPNAGYPADNGYIPSYPEDTYNPKPTNPPPKVEEYFGENEYIKSKGVCYKYTTYYDIYTRKPSNKAPIKVVAPKDEVNFCNISSYGGGSIDNNNINTGGSSGNASTPPNIVGDSGFLNEPVIKESGVTLQYTLDKTKDSPYYFDTGIRLSLNNKVTYEQIKDTLYQLGIKSGGNFVDDTERFLILAEGKVVVVKDEKKDIPVATVEDIFDNFAKLEVKALDTRIGSRCSIADYIEIKSDTKVAIDGKVIDLGTAPIVSNSRIMLPVKPLAEALGGKTTISSDKKNVTVKYNGNTIVFENGKNIAIVNGKTVKLDVPTKINSKGILFAQIQVMLEKFNREVIWDAQASEIVIEQK